MSSTVTSECHWVETKDPNTGRSYYANVMTKESSWVMPDELKAFKESGASDDYAVEDQADATELLFSGKQTHKKLDDEWVEVFDPAHGVPYFHNKTTKETVWTRPAHLKDVDDEVPATAAPVEVVTAPESHGQRASVASDKSGPAAAWAEKEEVNEEVKGELKEEATASQRGSVAAGSEPRGSSNDLGLPDVPSGVIRAASTASRPAAMSTGSGRSVSLSAAEDKRKEPEPTEDPKQRTSLPVTPVSIAPVSGLRWLLNPGKSSRKLLSQASSKNIDPSSVVAGPADEAAGKTKSPMQDNPALLRDISSFHIGDFAKEHFATRRRAGNMKKGNILKAFSKKAELQTMLVWDSQPLTRSLLKIKGDDVANEKALKVYLHVLAYMGDGPSPKGPKFTATDHAKYILRRGLMFEVLRDEIYCQLCKQVTANPSATSVMRGYHLLALCTGAFPPSEQFAGHLTEFLKAEASPEAPDGDAEKPLNPLHAAKMSEEKHGYATYCLERLERIMTRGARQTVPSTVEIEAVVARKDFPVTVELLDLTTKTVLVSSFASLKDVVKQVCRKLYLPESTDHQFGLWEIKAGKETMLNGWDRFGDVLGRQEQEKEEDPKLTFRLRLMKAVFYVDQDFSTSGPLLHFGFMQSVYWVTNSWVRITVEDALKLAALQAHVEFGEFQAGQETAALFSRNLAKYIPVYLHPQKKAAEWDHQIILLYKKLAGFDNSETKMHYIRYIRKNHLYGSTFFSVQQLHLPAKEAPKDCLVAINARGATLVRSDTREIVAKYEFAEMCSWTHDDDGFKVVRGNIYTQDTLEFKTAEGKVICDMIQLYVNHLISRGIGAPSY